MYKNKIKICPICKKEFAAKKDCKSRSQIYCSRACYGISIAKMKKCKNCGIEFYNWQNKYFCSMKCRGMSIRGKKLSKDHIKKLSLAKIGKPIPHIHNNPEVYKKISKTLTGKKRPQCYGEKHHNWKGGEHLRKKDGYIVKLEKHGEKKRVLKHRKIMEDYLGRKLIFIRKKGGKKEVIHHIDFDKENNDIENLEIMSLSRHTSLHMSGR